MNFQKPWVVAIAAIAILFLAACTPSVVPTPTPVVKALPAGLPTAALKAEATKPVEKPSAPATPSVSKPAGTPIKIGYLTPLTGRMGPYGQAQKIAVNMAADEINSSGGINGSPIKILMEDSAFDPKQAVSLARKLAEQDKIFAILGPFASGEFEVVGPLAVELKVPIIAGTTTKPGMSAANRPWAFRMTTTDDVSAPAGMDYMKKKYPQVKRVVIVGDTKESVSENMVRNIYPKFLKEKGFEVAGTADFETATTDYSAIVTKIKDMKPDALIYASLPGNAMAFAKEFKRQGLNVPVMASPQLQPAPPVDGMETWFMGGFFDQDAADTNIQKFISQFKKAADADSNVPKPFTVTYEPYIYDAAMVLAGSLRKAQVTGETPLDKARAAVMDGFQKLKDYKGIIGTFNMNADGDAITPAVPMMADLARNKWSRAQ